MLVGLCPFLKDEGLKEKVQHARMKCRQHVQATGSPRIIFRSPKFLLRAVLFDVINGIFWHFCSRLLSIVCYIAQYSVIQYFYGRSSSLSNGDETDLYQKTVRFILTVFLFHSLSFPRGHSHGRVRRNIHALIHTISYIDSCITSLSYLQFFLMWWSVL
jgi:hypothetical protein